MNINLAETHSFEIKEAGQVKLGIPQPKVTEQPFTPHMKQPQQTPKKIEIYLPTTGGKAENPYIRWIGLANAVLGLIRAVFAVRIGTKAQS